MALKPRYVPKTFRYRSELGVAAACKGQKVRAPIAVNRLGCKTYKRLAGLFINLCCWS